MKRRSFLGLVAVSAVVPRPAAHAQPSTDVADDRGESSALSSPSTGLLAGVAALDGVVPALVRFGGARDPVEAFVSWTARC